MEGKVSLSIWHLLFTCDLACAQEYVLSFTCVISVAKNIVTFLPLRLLSNLMLVYAYNFQRWHRHF